MELFALEHWKKIQYTYDGENVVSTLGHSLLIESSSNLHVSRTGIKAGTNSNYGQIWPLTFELHALERQNIPHLYTYTFKHEYL